MTATRSSHPLHLTAAERRGILSGRRLVLTRPASPRCPPGGVLPFPVGRVVARTPSGAVAIREVHLEAKHSPRQRMHLRWVLHLSRCCAPRVD